MGREMAESTTKTGRATASKSTRSKAVKPPVIEAKTETKSARLGWVVPALVVATLVGGGLGVAGSYGLAKFNFWPDASVVARGDLQASLADARIGLSARIDELSAELGDVNTELGELKLVTERPAPDLSKFSSTDDLAEIAVALSALEQSVSSRIEALKSDLTSVETVGVDLEPLHVSDAQLQTDLAGLGENLTALRDQIVALDAGLSGLSTQTGSLATQSGSLQDDIAAQNNKLEAQDSKFAALDDKLAVLDNKVEAQVPLSLITGPDSGDVIARLSLALTAIESALDRGTGFDSSLAVIAASDVMPAGLENIDGSGGPSPQALVVAFGKLSTTLVSAGAGDETNLPVRDKILSKLKSGIGMRPVGMVAGSDAGAIVARIEVYLDRGNFGQAYHEWRSLPSASRALSQSWADDVKDHLAVRSLVGQVRDAILVSNDTATGEAQ